MESSNPQNSAPAPFTAEEAAELKDFAQAVINGRLWMCRGFRILAAVGKFAGALAKVLTGIVALAAAVAAAWHFWRGGN